MAGSTAPACKSAVLTILDADAALDTVDLRWAPPTENEDFSQVNEAIFFGDTEILDDNWSSLGKYTGMGRRKETYRLTITAWVAQFGDEPRTVEERVWAIWADITEALRTDLFAGTPHGSASLLRAAGVQQFDQITALQSTGVFSPQQWGSRVDGRVTFTATTV